MMLDSNIFVFLLFNLLSFCFVFVIYIRLFVKLVFINIVEGKIFFSYSLGIYLYLYVYFCELIFFVDRNVVLIFFKLFLMFMFLVLVFLVVFIIVCEYLVLFFVK